MGAIITLLTDFGTRDGYVAAMKGAILSVCPDATLIDVSHEVPAQNIEAGAYLFETVWPFYPAGSSHLAVVDPGVGSSRRPIALAARGQWFVGPDNGLFSSVLADPQVEITRPGPHPLPAGARAVELQNPAYRRPVLSQTFHGRDLFGPAVGHLARGVPLDALGPALTELVQLPRMAPQRTAQGWQGRVVHVDHFGNLISNLRVADLPPGPLTVRIAGRTIQGLSRSYAEAPMLLAIEGSSGRIEVSVRGGSAFAQLGVGVGTLIEILCEPEPGAPGGG